jgi:hypothetical protein
VAASNAMGGQDAACPFIQPPVCVQQQQQQRQQQRRRQPQHSCLSAVCKPMAGPCIGRACMFEPGGIGGKWVVTRAA